MASIDITLPDELTQALSPPVCIDLSLPKVSESRLSLPTGGSLQGIADFTRGIPTDCSMHLNLMGQLAPMMASMDCLLKVLKFIGAIIGVLKNFNPLTAVGDVLSAAEDVAKCVGIAIPGVPICSFVKDVLVLISTMLACVGNELKSVLDIMSGLKLQIDAAEKAGNSDLKASLECAQQNAATSAQGTMQSLQPVAVLLSLAGAFMDIAGVKLDLSIPSGVPEDDLEAMQTLVKDIVDVANGIKQAAEALPC